MPPQRWAEWAVSVQYPPVGTGALAAKSGCGGDTMPKEKYVKPEVTTEVLEPDALLCAGTPADGGGGASPFMP